MAKRSRLTQIVGLLKSINCQLCRLRFDFRHILVRTILTQKIAYGVYMSQLIDSIFDFLHRSVLLTRKFLNQGLIETILRSTLKKVFGRYHHLTLPIVSQ